MEKSNCQKFSNNGSSYNTLSLHNKILILKLLPSKWTRKQSPYLNEITNMSHSNGVCSRIETVIGSERLLV